jgi:hypothetical protein
MNIFKVKKLGNPKENVWNGTNRNATISADGLQASKGTSEWLNLSASKGFAISVEQCRMDHFPGTILYYFEVTQVSSSERWVKLTKSKQILVMQFWATRRIFCHKTNKSNDNLDMIE